MGAAGIIGGKLRWDLFPSDISKESEGFRDGKNLGISDEETVVVLFGRCLLDGGDDIYQENTNICRNVGTNAHNAFGSEKNKQKVTRT